MNFSARLICGNSAFAAIVFALRKKFVSDFGYLAAFSNAGGSKVKLCFKRRQISHFLTPVKIRGGRDLYTNC